MIQPTPDVTRRPRPRVDPAAALHWATAPLWAGFAAMTAGLLQCSHDAAVGFASGVTAVVGWVLGARAVRRWRGS